MVRRARPVSYSSSMTANEDEGQADDDAGRADLRDVRTECCTKTRDSTVTRNDSRANDSKDVGGPDRRDAPVEQAELLPDAPAAGVGRPRATEFAGQFRIWERWWYTCGEVTQKDRRRGDQRDGGDDGADEGCEVGG